METIRFFFLFFSALHGAPHVFFVFVLFLVFFYDFAEDSA